MTNKVFEGQYNGEKILLRVHPHIMNVFFEKFPLFLMYFVVIILVISIGIFFHTEYIFIYFLIAGALFTIFGWYFWAIYSSSRYTITSRRCIYFIRKNIFKRKYNEIHLVDLRKVIPKKAGLFGMIFGYGNLILVDKDEKEIIYSGIKEQKYIARYLGRVIDYIKINGHTDNISQYQTRKERQDTKNMNNTK